MDIGIIFFRVGVKHELDRSSGDDVDAPPLKRIKRESILPKGLSQIFASPDYIHAVFFMVFRRVFLGLVEVSKCVELEEENSGIHWSTTVRIESTSLPKTLATTTTITSHVQTDLRSLW